MSLLFLEPLSLLVTEPDIVVDQIKKGPRTKLQPPALTPLEPLCLLVDGKMYMDQRVDDFGRRGAQVERCRQLGGHGAIGAGRPVAGHFSRHGPRRNWHRRRLRDLDAPLPLPLKSKVLLSFGSSLAQHVAFNFRLPNEKRHPIKTHSPVKVKEGLPKGFV